MKEIELYNGGVALVDDDDFEWLSTYRWSAYKPSARGKKYVCSYKDGKVVYMHRLILDAPKGITVDHINHDPLDNRRANLRLATRSQQVMNTPKRKTGKKSKYKGVTFKGKNSKGGDFRCPWKVEIQKDGVRMRLGEFTDEVEAAKAYDKAALELFGDFACVNFPSEVVA